MIKRAVEGAVRRWRWKDLAEKHPCLHGGSCNFDPIYKLLASMHNNDEWNPYLKAMLSSVLANRQFPQARCFQAGWVQHPKCIFCLEAEATGKPLDARLVPRTDNKEGSRKPEGESGSSDGEQQQHLQQQQAHSSEHPEAPLTCGSCGVGVAGPWAAHHLPPI